MEFRKQLLEELYQIHRSRNRVAYLPTSLIFFVSLYLQSSNMKPDGFMIACLVTAIGGLILRLLTYEMFYDAWKSDRPWARCLNIVGFLLLSFSWGIHFIDLYFHYGPTSTNVSYTLMILVGFITSASNSLTASKESYLSFILPMSLCVLWANLFAFPEIHIISALILTLFLVFSVSNYKVANKQLCDLIRAQLVTEKEKERILKMMNTVPGFVGLIDQHGVCYMANQTTLSLYPEIVGKKIGNFDPTSDWERFVLEFISSGRQDSVTEQKTTITGTPIHALLNLKKLDDGGVIVVSVLTTELVEARAKIREQEAHAQYTAKLASLGEMAAGIAHEVNNPLTIILGSANIMKKIVSIEPIDKNMLITLADKLVETTGRISKTIKSLKALSRNAENDPMTVVSVAKILDLSLDLCQQNLKNNAIELKRQDELQLYEVMGREVQLSQVVVNLINNAIDAVKTEEIRWIEFKAENDGEFVNIFVSDSGKGIPKEIQTRIMEPFFTTKDVNQGTGLGLSISKKIIEGHGGVLKLLPNSAHTTFMIRLKMAPKS